MLDSISLHRLLACQANQEAILECLDASGISSTWCQVNKAKISFQHPYSRKVLLQNDQCEIMLANWTPGVPCAPHNHGSSQGWVFYLSGAFRESHFNLNDSNLLCEKETEYFEGSHARVTRDEIHSCVSVTGGLSLHVYFPSIQNMKVYDRLKKRTLILSDDCGAWVPDDPKKIQGEIKW